MVWMKWRLHESVVIVICTLTKMPPFFLIKLSSHSYIHMGLVWEVDDFSLLGYFVCFWWVMYVLAGIGLGKDENI